MDRANLSDERITDRAVACGWEWRENSHDWPGCKEYPATGWKEPDAPGGRSFHNCKAADKVSRLRGKDTHCGFDHELDCVECGQPIWLMWCDDEEYIKSRECFLCHFWRAKIGRNRVVALSPNGTRDCYFIGKQTKPGNFNGFGGQWWTIRFDDGREVETCDLWHEGTIPERFHDRLPINAVLLGGRAK